LVIKYIFFQKNPEQTDLEMLVRIFLEQEWWLSEFFENKKKGIILLCNY